MYAFGIYSLGLDENHFRRLTLRKYNWLRERYVTEKEVEFESANLRTGAICAAIFNSQGMKKGDGKPYSPADFLTKKQEKKVQTVDEQKDILLRIGV